MKADQAVSRDDCIVWQGPIATNGYGKRQFRGRTVGAHRAAWEEAHGPIPDGLFVLHRCDNPPCCNADHLFLGTHTDNMRDMARKGRTAVRRGVDHPNCFLTSEQVDRARQMYRDGISQYAIGRQFAINQSVVSGLVRGISHGAMTEPHAGVVKCGACGKEVQRSRVTRKYCDKRCARRARRKILDARQLVDGRLTATSVERHGHLSTYTNYGCRCVPCATASTNYQRDWSKRR